LLEAILAIVAATGLAVLSHVFTSQRSTEFGVLNALGYPRRLLVWRVLKETAFTTCIAWGLSVIVVMAGIILTRSLIFAPLGLKFDLFNITPWLYTLPIPVAVLSISVITIARTLSRLDPVTIIEQRVY
jgi:ABC-type antimicrobial peptide transport system permease subunit